jgi:hypothetical protein
MLTTDTCWYRHAVIAYDWGYRLLHGLDRPVAGIGPLLRVERRRLRRELELVDGTRLRLGTPIGVLHLDNRRALALHGGGRHPCAIGFEFRRLFLTSLRSLGAQAVDRGPLAPLLAYSATTLFHRRLPLLGFAPAAGDRSIWRHLVTLYGRALLSSLHPTGVARLRRGTQREVRRLWISREALLARFGTTPEGKECRLERPSAAK